MDIIAQDEIRMFTGMDIKVGITLPSEIEMNLERLYTIQDSLEDASIELMDTSVDDLDLTRAMGEANPDDAPVIQLVNNVIEQAVRDGASDIHIEPFEKSTRVRYRIDGQLFNAYDFPKHLHPSVSSRMKIMSGMDISRKRRPQDGRILLRVLGRRVDLRVSSCPPYTAKNSHPYPRPGQRHGGPGNWASTPTTGCWWTKSAPPLRHSARNRPHGKRKIHHPVLRARADQQARSQRVTVEDPVEYTMHGIGQVQVTSGRASPSTAP